MSDLQAFKCPCGWDSLDDTEHADRHLEWAIGIRIPRHLNQRPYTEIPNLWRVRPDDPDGHELAFRLARLLKQEKLYDMTAWQQEPFTPELEGQAFYALIQDGRAISFLVTEITPKYMVYDYESKQCVEVVDKPRRGIGVIWTAFHWRKRGAASILIGSICRIYRTLPSELAWDRPRSNSGKRFALSQRKDNRLFLYD